MKEFRISIHLLFVNFKSAYGFIDREQMYVAMNGLNIPKKLIRLVRMIMSPTQSQINPYPTAFPYGNGMVLHFYQQQESSTTKTVHKVINKRLKTYV